MDPTEDRIRERAHQLWMDSGQPDGSGEEFWYAAERDLAADEAGYDDALADSFPASDPPGNSGITGPEAAAHDLTSDIATQTLPDPGGDRLADSRRRSQAAA